MILGKLESGTIRKGQSLTLMPNKVRELLKEGRLRKINQGCRSLPDSFILLLVHIQPSRYYLGVFHFINIKIKISLVLSNVSFKSCYGL